MTPYSLPNVDFFTVSQYEYQNSAVCDFSDCPRPHFCMGLILDGSAEFYPSGEDTPIRVSKGDIIFVPITSRYTSVWKGESIRYISYHFSFAAESGISERNNFALQKITPPDFPTVQRTFEYAYEHYSCRSDERLGDRLAVLGAFYSLLSSVLPLLRHDFEEKHDERIRRAVEYIRLHSEEDITIPALATLCNLSTSHFYTRFKKEVGMTPVDYKNTILVHRAVNLLLYGNPDSIESLASTLGFSSATYFRRVFKKVTGKSPSAYRKKATEI